MFKKVMTTLLILIMFFSVTISVTAYMVSSYRPGQLSFIYHTHESLSSTHVTAARAAAQTWSSTSDELKFYYGFGSSGNIEIGDLRNDIFRGDFGAMGLPSSAFGACFLYENNFKEFDIGFNSTYTWGNGSGENYYDLQGLLTHEFGHACGLSDLYFGRPELLGKTKQNVPTMYGHNSFDGTNNIYYYLRTLETDDKDGKAYIASRINN